MPDCTASATTTPPEIAVKATVTLSGFSPSEAEEITGVSCALQRQWRHRGLVAETPGHHAVYSVFALSRLLCLRLYGQGHKFGGLLDVVEQASFGVAWHALSWENAWNGDHLKVGTWDPAWVAQARCKPDNGWGFQANLLRQLAFQARGIVPVPQRYCIRWADGSHSLANDLDAATANVTGTLKTAGGMQALDLVSAGYCLVESATRELAFVELEIE